MNKKIEPSIVRSSAAEYLTFVAASGKGGVQAVYADENVWATSVLRKFAIKGYVLDKKRMEMSLPAT